MATVITSECINCGACEFECPNTAIYRGGIEWELHGETHPPLSQEIFYIVPEKCSECVGFFEREGCAVVCPVDCCVPDPNRPETEAVLMDRARELHPGRVFPDPYPSRFRPGSGQFLPIDIPPAGMVLPVMAAPIRAATAETEVPLPPEPAAPSPSPAPTTRTPVTPPAATPAPSAAHPPAAPVVPKAPATPVARSVPREVPTTSAATSAGPEVPATPGAAPAAKAEPKPEAPAKRIEKRLSPPPHAGGSFAASGMRQKQVPGELPEPFETLMERLRPVAAVSGFRRLMAKLLRPLLGQTSPFEPRVQRGTVPVDGFHGGTFEEKMERERRYGEVYKLEDRGTGYFLEFEFPRRVPLSATKGLFHVPDEMPPYDYDIRLEHGVLVIGGSVTDPDVRSVASVSPSFPPDFTTRIELGAPVRGFKHRVREKERVLEVVLPKS